MLNKKIEIVKAIENTENTVVTHGGIFHADDVMATVVLQKALSKELKVFRTFRVPSDLPAGIIVYDIGGGEYDHHMKGGNGSRDNGVPYSSVGLIWQRFGMAVAYQTNATNPERVWELVDRDLIQGIDAIDNGVLPKAEYPARALNVSQMISGFNPNWDESKNADEAFAEAVAFAEITFDNVLKNAVSKVNAEDIVKKAIEEAANSIMVLDRFVPWQEYLFNSENPKAKDILFVVYPALRGGFNCQCVPDTLNGTGQRKPAPAEWKGLSAEELQKLTGVADAIFWHQAGFMGSAESLEGAMKLARLALEA